MSRRKVGGVCKGAVAVVGFAGLECVVGGNLFLLPTFLKGDYLRCKWERNDVLRLIEKVIVELNKNKEALEKEKRALETRGGGDVNVFPPPYLFQLWQSTDQ